MKVDEKVSLNLMAELEKRSFWFLKQTMPTVTKISYDFVLHRDVYYKNQELGSACQKYKQNYSSFGMLL